VARAVEAHACSWRWFFAFDLKKVISGHQGWVRAIAVDPSNEWFATGAADRTLKVVLSIVINLI
jgi:WD40 repeat protein